MIIDHDHIKPNMFSVEPDIVNARARFKILGCSSQSHKSCISIDYLLKFLLEFPQMANIDVRTGFCFSTIFSIVGSLIVIWSSVLYGTRTDGNKMQEECFELSIKNFFLF